jgi:hypothetical protein
MSATEKLTVETALRGLLDWSEFGCTAAHSQVHALSMTMRGVAQASVSRGEQSFSGHRRMVGCGRPFPRQYFLFFFGVQFSQTNFFFAFFRR